MRAMTNKEIGAYGEKLARRFLRKNGYRIVEKNYTTHRGEVDIIAKNKKYIVFCEVKTRSDTENLQKYGRPARAVNHEKRAHILAVSKEYFISNHIKIQPRIDIIEVYLDPQNAKRYRIVHIENAFGGNI